MNRIVKYSIASLGAVVATLWLAGQASADGAIVYCGFGDVNNACIGTLTDTGHIEPGTDVRAPFYEHELGPIITPGGQTMAEGAQQGADNAQVFDGDLIAQGVDIYGVSEGSAPAIELGARTGLHVNLYGAPQVAGGFFHGDLAQTPGFEQGLQVVAGADTDQVPQSGSDVWCNEGDVWCNFTSDQYDVIQDINKANDTMVLDGHWVQPNNGTENAVCIDEFGVEVHSFEDGNPYTHNYCQPGPLARP